MLLALEDHAPQARCYRCGSPDIFAVCHHCGAGMCQEHTPRTVDGGEKPVSKEFQAWDSRAGKLRSITVLSTIMPSRAAS